MDVLGFGERVGRDLPRLNSEEFQNFSFQPKFAIFEGKKHDFLSATATTLKLAVPIMAIFTKNLKNHIRLCF